MHESLRIIVCCVVFNKTCAMKKQDHVALIARTRSSPVHHNLRSPLLQKSKSCSNPRRNLFFQHSLRISCRDVGRFCECFDKVGEVEKEETVCGKLWRPATKEHRFIRPTFDLWSSRAPLALIHPAFTFLPSLGPASEKVSNPPKYHLQVG